MTDRYWCELAVVDGSVRRAVSVDVADGRFARIATDSDATPGATRLAGLTVPGFANSHSHAFHRALRSRTQGERGTFWTWREVMYRAAAALDPDRYHRLARAVFAEMASAGFSCVGEFHYLHHQPDGMPYGDPNAMGAALSAAADDAGIRITLLDTLYLHGGLGPDGHLPVKGAQLRYRDASVDAWAERVAAIDATDTRRIGAAVHSVRAVDPAAIRAVGEWAAAHGAPVHAHVSEQVAENEQCRARHGCSPVRLLADHGLLGDRFTAVHATHVTPDDVDTLSASGSRVCMCPTTERDLGDGIGPASSFTSAGVEVCLGSDSHAVIDHFVEMRLVELHDRLATRSRGLHTAAELLAMATVAGHASLGWADAGAIAVGNRADLTTIDLASARTAGATDELAIEAAVFAATSADVTGVIVDGTIVADRGRHARVDAAAELSGAIAELLG